MTDISTCMKCGTQEHIDLLDAKPPPGANPETCDWTHFECIACYGFGWDTTLSPGEMQAASIVSALKPLYLKYYEKAG